MNFPLDIADIYVNALPLPTRESEPYVNVRGMLTRMFQHSNTQVLCELEHDA